VATNVCLDAIARDERRSVLDAKSVENGAPPSTDEVAWLQVVLTFRLQDCGASDEADANQRRFR